MEEFTPSKDMGVIELPKFDVKQYVGKKAKIASVRYYEDSYKGKPTKYFVATTESIDKVSFNGEEKEITANLRVGLQVDANGVVGWGEDTKCAKLLKAHKITHPDQLIGQEVIVQLTQPNDEEKQYLTFT